MPVVYEVIRSGVVTSILLGRLRLVLAKRLGPAFTPGAVNRFPAYAHSWAFHRSAVNGREMEGGG